MTLSPGDILFYHSTGTWTDRIICWLQQHFKERGTLPPGTDYVHVAMVADRGTLIEMVWPRPRFRALDGDVRPKTVMRPALPVADIGPVLASLYTDVWEHYSIWTMLLGQLRFVHAHKCCSAWIDNAFKNHGILLTDPADRLISPDELASSPTLYSL